jgi:uncharacterized protein
VRALAIAVVVALLGCRGGGGESRRPPPTAPSPTQVEADPWAVHATTTADDPPTLVERKKLADAACPTVKGPYFYRIEKAGKTSHMLGTRHISVPLAKFPQSVRDALAASKLAVFEVAPDDKTDLDSPKVSLPDELGPDLWSHYQKIVGTQTAKALERATPAEAMIAMIAMYEDIGAMLDLEIQRQAEAARIPTAGLESSAFQDALLEKLLDLRMLRAEVTHTKDRSELEKEAREDLGEYCAGTDDKPGMDEDSRKDLIAAGYTAADLDQIDDEMVYKRNADWIPKLEKMFETGNVFVAVGADHLIGTRGVVALLQARGFTVTRVTK